MGARGNFSDGLQKERTRAWRAFALIVFLVSLLSTHSYCRDTFGQTSSRGWDQFSVNEKLYGYQTTYREEIYTTELDKNSAAYRERIEHATRLANEIEKVCSTRGFFVGLMHS